MLRFFGLTPELQFILCMNNNNIKPESRYRTCTGFWLDNNYKNCHTAMTQNEIDRRSIEKAKELFSSAGVYDIEVGTTAGLQAIHHALYDGLYPFAGEVRKLNITKGGFRFANSLYLIPALDAIENYNIL